MGQEHSLCVVPQFILTQCQLHICAMHNVTPTSLLEIGSMRFVQVLGITEMPTLQMHVRNLAVQSEGKSHPASLDKLGLCSASEELQRRHPHKETPENSTTSSDEITLGFLHTWTTREAAWLQGQGRHDALTKYCSLTFSGNARTLSKD